MYGLQAQFGIGVPNVPGMNGSEWESFMKAITAGYGTDLSTLSGGGALRVESLESTLMAVVQTMKDFALFNKLGKTPATATVDEWIEMSNVGYRLGGAFNTELGNINAQSGTYNRRVAFVKYLVTRRSVSFVQNVQQSVISAKAQEEVNGTLELLSSAEWACFGGDSSVVPAEFDGLQKSIEGSGSADNVIDLGGAALDTNGFQAVLNAAQVIRKRGHFGRPTDLFLSVAAQTDLDQGLDPAFRVPLNDVPNGGISLGSPVVGVRTSFGNIATNPDIFLEESKIPDESLSPSIATASDPTPPVSMTAAVNTDAASKFTAANAGNYYYRVASISNKGESTTVLVSAGPIAVAAGQSVTLTITRSGAIDETGYIIYRGRLNGTNGASDMRAMRRVAYSGSPTTVYVDQNRDIPGTSKGFVLNMDPAYNAISIRQLLPMTRFQLYPTQTAEDPWAQLLFCYLRVTKALQHVMIKNILPNTASAKWHPFGANNG